MLVHRVNSEGLRRRAIAHEAAARREGVYRLWSPVLSMAGLTEISPVDSSIGRQFLLGRTPREHARSRAKAVQMGTSGTWRRTAATFLRVLCVNLCRCRNAGERQYQIACEPRRSGRVDGAGGASCCAFRQGVNHSLPFDSEVRMRACRKDLRTSESGHWSAIATAGDGGLGPS